MDHSGYVASGGIEPVGLLEGEGHREIRHADDAAGQDRRFHDVDGPGNEREEVSPSQGGNIRELDERRGAGDVGSRQGDIIGSTEQPIGTRTALGEDSRLKHREYRARHRLERGEGKDPEGGASRARSGH